jgi:hypothetical protein
MSKGSRDGSVGIGTGRPRGRSPGRGNIYLFSASSRQALGATYLPIQCVAGALSSFRGQEYMDLYIHSPVRLHGEVLN